VAYWRCPVSELTSGGVDMTESRNSGICWQTLLTLGFICGLRNAGIEESRCCKPLKELPIPAIPGLGVLASRHPLGRQSPSLFQGFSVFGKSESRHLTVITPRAQRELFTNIPTRASSNFVFCQIDIDWNWLLFSSPISVAALETLAATIKARHLQLPIRHWRVCEASPSSQWQARARNTARATQNPRHRTSEPPALPPK